MPSPEALVIGLGVSAVVWFALFEGIRRRAGTGESRAQNLAIAGAVGTFLLMTAALAVALKHWY